MRTQILTIAVPISFIINTNNNNNNNKVHKINNHSKRNRASKTKTKIKFTHQFDLLVTKVDVVACGKIKHWLRRRRRRCRGRCVQLFNRGELKEREIEWRDKRK